MYFFIFQGRQKFTYIACFTSQSGLSAGKKVTLEKRRNVPIRD